MDLLAPCRSCLQCLPFFQVSSPSSSRPPAATSTGPSSSSAQEAASIASTTLDPGEYTQSSADAALEAQLDLPTSVKEEEPHLPSYSSVENGSDLQAIAEYESNPMSEIIIAPPVCSPPRNTAAATYEEEELTKTTAPSEQLPLLVPFINDISFSTSGLMPLPSPMTPAPFGAGYTAPAGQYHPSLHVYPPANDDSHDSNGHSLHAQDKSHDEHVSHDEQGPLHHGYADVHQGHSSSHHGDSHDSNGHSLHAHDNSHDEHVSHDEQGPLHHGYADVHQGHSSSHHGDWQSHHVHGVSDESPVHDVADETQDTSTVTLETSNFTPGYLDMDQAKQGGNNGATDDTGGDSALIETYHSEPITLSGVPEEDDSYTPDEGLSHSASLMGGRRRRRFKEQFKGISQQIKHGGHHLKEEGSKHLQTIISNMNKQAQQIEQSGSFYIVPRANNN